MPTSSPRPWQEDCGRVEVEPGDAVERGSDVVAFMAPSNPAVLDVRTREQARANVSAAEAALRLAQAERNRGCC